jgi:AAA family ATP:ADP antiporter
MPHASARPVPPLFDVRAGEERFRVAGFAALLMLVIGAHTILETARDALLLTGPGPRALGLVYIVIAVATVPCAAAAGRAGERFGQRRTLAGALLVAIAGPLVLMVLPASHGAAIAIYVLSGLLGSILVPLFWTLMGTVFTVAQGRRLFGLIAAGGIVGGVLGPAVASGVLILLPVRSLLVVASLVFALALSATGLVRAAERTTPSPAARRVPLTASLRAFREQPFLGRVALLVFLSTATFLAIDYLFKSSVARAMPGPRVGPFMAHYYLGLNCVSLVLQLVLTGPVVRRLGVVPALVLTPVALLGAAIVAFATGGAFAGALAIKGVDGSLRYSLHRATGELVYLPVPGPARRRAKPLIDGALVRAAQTLSGVVLLALGGTALLGPARLAAIVASLAALWLVTTLTMRRSYLSLLQRAVTAGTIDATEAPDPMDLETAQLLVQRLASENPSEVEGAMSVLSRRGQAGLVPALVLLHGDERVLVLALDMFGGSARSDWFGLGRRLLGDPRERVRVAAARALARHEQLDGASLANDVGLRARAYASVRMALRDESTEVETRPEIAQTLAQLGADGDAARLGLLAAIVDGPRTPRLLPLLRVLAREPHGTRERAELLARAIARQRDVSLIAVLVALLAVRDGREAVRAALVDLGDAAFEEVYRTLRDASCERRLRIHMPKTLARFASNRAAACLLSTIEEDRDGLVRYKAIQSLRALVTEHRIAVDRRRTERLCARELEEHFARLAFLTALGANASGGEAGALLQRLLEEKAAHALERAFHLLQIAHPRQGVHHAFVAFRSGDAYLRATGAELVEALLRGRQRSRLRALFQVATDDASRDARVARARALGLTLARSSEDVLAAMGRSGDAILVALAGRWTVEPAQAPWREERDHG